MSLRRQWNSGIAMQTLVVRHSSLAESKVTVESTKTSATVETLNVSVTFSMNVSVTFSMVLVNVRLRPGPDWRLLGAAAASVARRVVTVGMRSILGVF